MSKQYDRTLLDASVIPNMEQMQENLQKHDYTSEMHLMDPKLDEDLHLPGINEQKET